MRVVHTHYGVDVNTRIRTRMRTHSLIHQRISARRIPFPLVCGGRESLKGQAPLSRRAAPARVKGVAARSSPEERSSVGRGSALERV